MKQITKVRVRYGETDKMGVAYYGLGKSFAAWESEGILLPVVEAHCRYKSSLYYDEEIEIETEVTKISKVSVVFSCKIFHADTKKLAAEGYTKHAFTSTDGKLLRDGNNLEKWLKELSETE